eukprot:11475439-Heterocapsa_arctica.AAC.1
MTSGPLLDHSWTTFPIHLKHIRTTFGTLPDHFWSTAGPVVVVVVVVVIVVVVDLLFFVAEACAFLRQLARRSAREQEAGPARAVASVT